MPKHSSQRFGKLLNSISHVTQAYAKYLTWNPSDIEDIFQLALLNAYQKFDTYLEGTNFKAWLFRFVAHAAYNVNRRHEKFRKSEVSWEPKELENIELAYVLKDEHHYEAFFQNPESILEYTKDDLRNAVRSLPFRRRNIFLLRIIGELTYKEIAAFLDIPIGSVMGELFRARHQLRVTFKRNLNKKETVKKEDSDDL